MPHKQSSLRIGPQAVQGAKRRSEPLTARTDPKSSKARGKGGRRAKQYAEDQKRLSGQVERLEKQVRQLDESHGEAEKRYTQCLEIMTLTRISNLIQTSRPSGGLERLYS